MSNLEDILNDPDSTSEMKQKAAQLLEMKAQAAVQPAPTGPVALHGQKNMHCGAGEFASVDPITVSREWAVWLRRDGHSDEEAASSARAFLLGGLSSLYFWQRNKSEKWYF